MLSHMLNETKAEYGRRDAFRKLYLVNPHGRQRPAWFEYCFLIIV